VREHAGGRPITPNLVKETNVTGTLSITALTLLGVVTTADAELRHAPRPAQIVIVPVPVYVPPPLPYDFYYQQELAKRWPPRPSPIQSFEGASPRCPRFFCEVAP
jgi:hypothetical protein